MRINKKGMEEVADIFYWFFIIFLVIFFFLFMSFSGVIKSGDKIEGVSEISNEIDTYNYHPSLLG